VWFRRCPSVALLAGFRKAASETAPSVGLNNPEPYIVSRSSVEIESVEGHPKADWSLYGGAIRSSRRIAGNRILRLAGSEAALLGSEIPSGTGNGDDQFTTFRFVPDFRTHVTPEDTFRHSGDLPPRALLLLTQRPPDYVLRPPPHGVVVSLRSAAGSETGPPYKAQMSCDHPVAGN
jgi:hypothetical protein